jgi:hypothetical protein
MTTNNNQTGDTKMKTYRLTTNHAASSYGQPVLVDEAGTAYGPNDILPTGEGAVFFVARMERGGSRLMRVTPQSTPEPIERLDLSECDGFDPLEPAKKFAEVAEFLRLGGLVF